MKVLIVDDEEDVRNSIKLLVNWSEFQIDTILEAEEGSQAIAIIQSEKPEIIFTDMIMPNVDGLELLQWINQSNPDSKTIVVSGHDDYRYVRHTVKNGGFDYILKPINQHELIEVLRKAVNSWRLEEATRQQDQKHKMVLNQSKPAYWDKIFANIVTKPIYVKTVYDELTREFNLAETQSCQIVVLSMELLSNKVSDKFNDNLDLLYFLMINICNEIIGRNKEGFAFKHTDPDNEIVLMFWKNVMFIKDRLTAINEAFQQILHTKFSFGIGGLQPFPERIYESYKDAKMTLRQKNYLSRNTWILFASESQSNKANTLFFLDYSDKIALAIKSNDSKQIEAAIQQWIDSVKKLEVITLDHLKYWWYEYKIMRTQLLKEIFPEDENMQFQSQRTFFPVDDYGVLSLDLWKGELYQFCMNFAVNLHNKQQKDQNVIYEIKAFVDSRYNQNLMLQEIADQFFISREYISRKFKQEFNENISDYIERIRVEKSQILLKNGLLSINEVASLVGYPDGRYFSKVFRKLTGYTPAQFRKRAAAQ
jgi:two-component system response regulator YesN